MKGRKQEDGENASLFLLPLFPPFFFRDRKFQWEKGGAGSLTENKVWLAFGDLAWLVVSLTQRKASLQTLIQTTLMVQTSVLS